MSVSIPEGHVSCPVCEGTTLSKYTGRTCGCCYGVGYLTEKTYNVKMQISKDLRGRLEAQENQNEQPPKS